MKTYKPRNYGFLIKTFGLAGYQYFSPTILVWFDLTNPDNLLTEQELWSNIPQQLGDQPLDQGFPKPHGEIVVSGSCFAPRNTTTTASEVAVQIGEVHKKLSVFGNRFWQTGNIPSSPEPFTEIPVTWKNAFGGKGYDRNPTGKGIRPLPQPDGSSRTPLPNIEIAGQLIGSPGDRPSPAGFDQVDMMWPQRFSKCGTYENQWLQERWPWFPDDLNPEFFNVAPPDQFIEGFFRGDELITITNMHPDFPVINSRLPAQRPRCFVTRKKDLKPAAETEFIEVGLKADTVWLFPSILRGLVMYRGSLKVKDDEYADLERVFVAAETMAEDPKSPDFYFEEQKKIWNRAVDIDMAPLEKAKKKIADNLKKTRQIPKQIELAKMKAMGKAPRMQRSPEEMADNARQTIVNSYKLLDDQEKMARDLQAKHGHLVAIDLTMFDRMREKLAGMITKVDNILAKAKEVQQKGDQVKSDMSAQLKKSLTPEQLEQAGIKPDDLLPAKKVNLWHDRGFPLVIQWRKNLEKDSDAYDKLQKLGFEKHTVKRGWFGVLPEERQEQMQDWGEKEQDFPLPKGLVMPRFAEATLVSVRIRPGELTRTDKDILVPGSKTPPLFLSAIDIGAPVIHVEDELTAWLVEQEIGDACAVLAMAEPDEKPGDDAANAMKDALLVLTVRPDSGDGSPRDWEKWQKIFPEGKPAILPAGKNLYDIHQKEGIRSWLMQFLPDEFSAANNVDITLPEAGKPPTKSPVAGLAIPTFDVKGMVKGFSDDIKAFHQPKIDEINKLKKGMEAKAREAILKAGKDPDEIMNAAPEKKSFAATGKDMADKILQQKDKLKGQGVLTPENEQKMNDAAAQVLKMGQEGEQRYQEGMQKLAAAREKIAKVKTGELPDELKTKFAAAGVDPDRLKKLTREEVIARHEQGMSLEGANLNEVDLSGLDLTGIDLTKAMCRKTIFKGSVLQNAIFDQTLAQEADLTETDLRGSSINMAILNKAKFKEADIRDVKFKQAMLKEADMEGARFAGAHVYMTVLQKANLAKADFARADCEMSVFSDATANEGNFAGARLKKCLFKRTLLDKVDFSGASFPSTLLHGATGKDVKFTGADFTKGRMAGECKLSGSDFKGITMDQGSFRDSDLSGSDFHGAVISQSILENCDLSEVDLTGVSAKKTRFSKSNLEGAKMAGINLFLGSLRKAKLLRTDLSNSNLFAVDLYKSVLGETNFNGANLKKTLLHKRTEYLDDQG